MATLTAANPRLVGGPVMQTVDMLILNGQSWKAGQFLNVDASGLLNTCVSDDDTGNAGVKYYALEDQSDPGNSTTYATVGIITADHIFEMNELDGTLTGANIGIQYGIDVTSNVVTVDVGDTSNPAVKVLDIASNYAPLQNSSTDVKARCKVQVLQAAIDGTPG